MRTALGSALTILTVALGLFAQSPEELLQKARALREANRYYEAVEAYRELLSAVPNHLQAKKELGILYASRREHWKNAVPLLEEYLQAVPDDPEANRALGEVLVYLNRIREALPYLEKTVQLNPADDKTRLLLAQVYVWLGHPQKALPHFREVERSSPGLFDDKAHLDYAECLIATGHYREAARVLRKLARWNPTDPEIRRRLAVAYAEAGNRREADRLFRALVRERPKDVDLILTYARYLVRWGRYERAYRFYRKALDLRPTDLSLWFEMVDAVGSRDTTVLKRIEEEARSRLQEDPEDLLGNLLLARALSYHKGREDQAVDFYLFVLEKAPENRMAWRGLRDLLRNLPGDTLYLSLYPRLITRYPEDAMLRLRLAEAYLQKGEQEKAVLELEKAARLDPENLWVNLALGGLYLEMGLYGEAIPYLERAVEKDPRNFDALKGLGGAYRALGEKQKALEFYQRALAVRPDPEIEAEIQAIQTELKAERAAAFMAQGQPQEALSLYRELLQEFPDSVPFLLGAAGAYLKLGEAQKALELYDRILSLRTGLRDAAIGKGWALLALGRYKEAAETIRKAGLKEDPEGRRILREAETVLTVRRAEALKAEGKPQEALKLYHVADTLSSGRVDVLLGLGGAAMAAGQYEEAARAFLRALEVEPQNREALFGYADALVALGRPEEALRFLMTHQQALGREAEGRIRELTIVARIREAESRKARGDLEGTLEVYRALYKEYPDDLRVVMGLAGAYAAAGRHLRAYVLFRRALELDPTNMAALRGLVGSLLALGRDEDALEAVEQAAQRLKTPELDSLRQELHALTLVRDAERAKERGDYVRAESLYVVAYNENPQDYGVLIGLAGLYAEMGRFEKAARFYREALVVRPQDTQALKGLTGALLAQGKEEEALPYLEALYRKTHDPQIGLKLADILARKKKRAEAYRILVELRDTLSGDSQYLDLLRRVEVTYRPEFYGGVIYRNIPGFRGPGEDQLTVLSFPMGLGFPLGDSRGFLQVEPILVSSGPEFSDSGVGLWGGLRLNLPATHLYLAVGTSPIGFDWGYKVLFDGQVAFRIGPVELGGGAHRRAIDESFQSYAGRRVGGTLYGGVLATGGRVYLLFAPFPYDITAEARYELYQGHNIGDNARAEFRLTAGVITRSTGRETWRLGYSGMAMAFQRFGLGRYGAGGGGYFNPRAYSENMGTFDLRRWEGPVYMELHAAFGLQTLIGDSTAYFTPGNRLGSLIRFLLRYPLGKRVDLEGEYRFLQSFPYFGEHRVRLWIRSKL